MAVKTGAKAFSSRVGLYLLAFGIGCLGMGIINNLPNPVDMLLSMVWLMGGIWVGRFTSHYF